MIIPLEYFEVRSVVGGPLAGAEAGRHVREAILRRASAAAEPMVLLIDFHECEVATASWLREALVTVLAESRSRELHLYIAITQASQDILDELAIVLEHTGEVITEVVFRGEALHLARIRGDLEIAQWDTFKTLCEDGCSSGSELYRKLGTLTAPAWNNRLASLHDKRLVASIKSGRNRIYQTLFEGKIYGM